MRRCFFLVSVALLAAATPGLRGQSCNPIVCENQLPGTPPSQWDIGGAGDASLQGFATSISVNKGETVHFKVDTTASTFQIDIYRLGYYGGLGARRVASLGSFAGRDQANCLTVSSTGLIDCGNWLESASWPVPGTAVSGVYIARLSRADTGGASHVAFVVRDDAAQADVLFQTSDTTWQAYNSYGGNSLYVGGPGTNPGRAYKVSYNRPFTTRSTSPEDWLFNAEYPMIRWLEANGFNVSYLAGADTDRIGGTELPRHRAFLSVGHDEYWSGPQRANVEAARNAGVHLAFFSGNELFWKTRWESSVDGASTPYRTLVSYKETHANRVIDPADPPTWTGTWRDPRFSPPADGGRPENALTGTIFTVNCCNPTAAIRVSQTFASQPFWRNTRVATLPSGGSTTLAAGTLGYEWDENLNNGFRPAGLTTLSSTTLSVNEKLQDYGSTYAAGNATHALTQYRHASGALVFGAGTVQWSWGLDGTHDRGGSTPDLAMQQATVNLLFDMGVSPGSLQPGLVSGTGVPAPPPPPPPPLTLPVRINAGGPAFTDGAGQLWAADANFSGGATYSKTSAIAGTSDDALFQTERYGNFSYNLPLSNGTYVITLRFAELYWTGAGKRVFNVTVEGQPFLTNFDIFAAAGANTAIDRPVQVTVTDGVLNIGFVTVVDNAKVSAIQVVPAGVVVNQSPVVSAGADRTITLPTTSVALTGTASDDGLPAPPAALTYGWSLVTGLSPVTFSAPAALATTATFTLAGTYSLRLTVSDSVLTTADDTVITVNSPSAFAPVRINAGGPAFTDSAGQAWAADKNFSGGTTYSKTTAIGATVDDALFQTERYGGFSYSIPVPNGTYAITLRFAELYWTSAGKRVFNVTVEGQPFLTNFDIFAAAGAATAVDRTVQVTVTDGTLNIGFVTVVDNAKVSAIQVVAMTTP